MSYTPTVWETGDIVTSEKLNKLEQGVVDAQNGYTVETTPIVVVPEQSVATVASEGVNVGELTGDIVMPSDGMVCHVSFEGNEYTIPAVVEDFNARIGELVDGAPSFINYPFFIQLIYDDVITGYFATETAGTYTVEVEGDTETVTAGRTFKAAVKDAMPYWEVNFTFDVDLETVVCDRTYAELQYYSSDNVDVPVLAFLASTPLLILGPDRVDDQNVFCFLNIWVGIDGGAPVMQTQKICVAEDDTCFTKLYYAELTANE